MNKLFPWERFWVSPQKTINLTREGFLEDPEEKYGLLYNPNVVKFDAIKNKQCLILLGEPGIGKSNALSSERINIENEIKTQGQLLIWLNLSMYNDVSSLEKFLFECKKFKQYLESNCTLHVYLDGFDECKISIPQLIDYLFPRFKDYQSKRFFIRIACRTAIWPWEAEAYLKDIWDEENIGVFELVPLRIKDVNTAAQVHGVNAEEFIKEVLKAGAGPFACRPITFNMLLDIYKKEQALPQKRSDLYYHGCLRLAEELNESRRRSKRIGKLTSKQRLKVAAQIAMLMMIGNYGTIWMGVETDKPNNSLSMGDLCECLENSKPLETLAITREILEEVIDTGLFSSRGDNLIGWSHQTFAEYLSVLALVETKLDNEKMLELLCNPTMENKIVPQLYETASWLIELKPIIANQILEKQPEIITESDVLMAPGIDKARLVKNVLELAEHNLLYIDARKAHLRYSKLNHDHLASQLSHYIENPDKNENARSIAMDIAIACQLSSLQTLLLNVALKESEAISVRIEAAYAISKILDDDTKQKLKPLALGLVGDDPDDELKGIALKALWPSGITAEELFTILTPPKNTSLIGAYSTFINTHLANSFTAKDLPYALNWVATHKEIFHLDYGKQQFIDAIMIRAWSLLEEPEVLDHFAKTAWKLLCQHDHIFNNCRGEKEFEGLSHNCEKRRMLTRAIISLIKNAEQVQYLTWPQRLLYDEDIPWLLEILKESTNEQDETIITKLISQLVHFQIKTSLLNLLLDTCGIDARNRHNKLAQVLKHLVEPIVLDSEEADKCRDHYELMKKSNERRQHKLMIPLPEEHIEQALIKIELGQYQLWPKLLYNLSFTPEGQHKWVGDDVLEQHGWKSASSTSRQRIIRAAVCYLEKGNLDVEELFNDKGSYQFSTVAAYSALIMLYNEAPQEFNKITASSWEKWAPLIITYPFVSENRIAEHTVFLQKAYQVNPEVVLNAVDIRCNVDLKNSSTLFILDRVEAIWDKKLSALLLRKLYQPNLTSNALKALLNPLLERHEPEAKEFALDIIKNTFNASDENKENAITAASLLIEHMADTVWLEVWPILHSDITFGRAVFLMLVNTTHSGIKPIINLNEYQIAEIYIWLEEMFPEYEDPQHKGAHFVGARDEIKFFRNGCISYLRDKGTLDACKALEKIAEAFPEKPWVHQVIFDARQITRNATWLPLRPIDIIKFINNEHSFLVRSEEELLKAIKSSLSKIQDRFPQQAFCVWDEHSNRPSPEGRLSDYIKDKLTDLLKNSNAVINREIEIFNTKDKGIGERLDLLVEAIVINNKGHVIDKIGVVIEVKGCWNRDLMTAMKDQLKECYLDKVGSKTGLYLVGWYYCDRWTKDDYRKGDCRRVTKGSLDEVKKVLNEQAHKLSSNDIHIESYILDITY